MAKLMPPLVTHFDDDNGNPLVGGKVFFYEAGTSTPKNTFTDANSGIPNPNPVVLNARGDASIWLTAGEPYKAIIKRADDSVVRTVDFITRDAADDATYVALEAAEAARDVAIEQAGIATAQAVIATEQRVLSEAGRVGSETARTGSEAARDAALLSRGVFASTADALSKGVNQLSITGNGSGGTNGAGFKGTFTGGGGTAAEFSFTVAGGAIVPSSVIITASGKNYTSAPTGIDVSASAGLTGVTFTAGIGFNVSVGEYFSVASGSTESILILYRVDAGPVAAEVNRYLSSNSNLIARSLPLESGYVLAYIDPVTGRAVLGVTPTGTVEIFDVKLPSMSVGMPELKSEVLALIPTTLLPESGYVWALVDPLTGRSPVRVTREGVFEADTLTPPMSSVAPGAFTDAAKRQALPQIADVQPTSPQLWRTKMADVAARTNSGDGSMFVPFPSVPAKLLRGQNNSGTALEFRKSAGLLILGRSYVGTFDPGIYPSITLKGQISGPSVSAPGGIFVAGDYYQYVNGNGDTSTGTFSGMKVGDLLVYDGTQFRIQFAPGTFNARNMKAWWDVTVAGWFDGVQYAIGDKIMYVTRQPGGGGFQYERWYKHNRTKGDLAYRGEFAPGSGLPASFLDGDVFQASASGSAGGFTFTTGDYLLRMGSVWEQIVNDAAISVASSATTALRVIGDAAEIEVRRADKSATVVGVRLSAQVQSTTKCTQDKILVLGDSMPGVGGVGDAIILAAGRPGTTLSYGGGSSEQVLGMLEYDVATQGDNYRANILIAWHGQNNQPSNESNAAQIRSVSSRMAGLIGARDRKLLFLSVLGQRVHTYNGTRIVVSQHEDQFSGASHLAELNRWYEAAFPGQWMSPLSILLAAATDAADPTFPGMTEKQVAAKYGIAPWSAFSGATLGYSTNLLVFQGYYSTAGLPVGGADKDYYIRTANGTVGNLLINTAGVWSELSIDVTHLGTVGATMMATGGAGSNLGVGFNVIPSSPGVAGFLNNNFI